MTDMVEAEQKRKKLYKRGWGRKEESKLSSRMEAVRNFETHNLNVVSFLCVCLLWVERTECVRQRRQTKGNWAGIMPWPLAGSDWLLDMSLPTRLIVWVLIVWGS